MTSPGKLLLISTPLLGQEVDAALPKNVIDQICGLKYFLAENAKTARHFLKSLPLALKIQELEITEIEKDQELKNPEKLLTPVKDGHSIGLLSETGAPCLADPGARVVRTACSLGIKVEALVGPSAVMLAIVSSGLNGQNFAFNGYLPIKSPDLDIKIKELEALAIRTRQSQFFIETPYRLQKLFDKILNVCKKDTLISVSKNLGAVDTLSETASVAKWQKLSPDFDDALAVIGIGTE